MPKTRAPERLAARVVKITIFENFDEPKRAVGTVAV
jgi:hypothetical protein